MKRNMYDAVWLYTDNQKINCSVRETKKLDFMDSYCDDESIYGRFEIHRKACRSLSTTFLFSAIRHACLRFIMRSHEYLNWEIAGDNVSFLYAFKNKKNKKEESISISNARWINRYPSKFKKDKVNTLFRFTSTAYYICALTLIQLIKFFPQTWLLNKIN